MKQLLVLTLALAACGDNTDKVTTEPPGSNCPNGGVAIESDGSTTYVCDGTDGSDGTSGQMGAAGSGAAASTWTTITADTTAQASYGYIADAASAITLTLPPTTSLSPGDDVRLVVHGAADVSVAPNGAQTFDYDRAQLGWRPLTTTPSVPWSQMAMSGDGASLVGMAAQSSIYRSGDSGATWSHLTGMTNQELQAIVASSDGSVIGVGSWGNGFWYSTDSGTSWTQSGSGPGYAQSLAMSADGTTLFAIDESGNQLESSTDSGADWSTLGTPPGQYIVSLACSADCSSVFADDELGGLYVYQASTGWTQLTTISNGESTGKVASAADGTTLVVTVASGQIISSQDAGATWRSASVPPVEWYPVAISADGTTMLAGANSYGVAMSKDSGATWSVVDATRHPWQSVAIAGARPIAVASDGGIYGPGNGSVLATHASELDFIYEGGGAFLITSDGGTAYGPY